MEKTYKSYTQKIKHMTIKSDLKILSFILNIKLENVKSMLYRGKIQLSKKIISCLKSKKDNDEKN